MRNKFRWRVSKKQAGMRLLQFLRESCSGAPSVKAIKRAIDGKLCTVNHRTETFSSFTLSENDVVALSSAAFEEKEESLPVPLLYEDKELLIVNKPVGLVSENKALRPHFPQFPHLELVHRLDKETSGVLILAKSAKAKEKMIELFKTHSIRKLYLALVDGVVAKEEGVIDNFLGKKRVFEGQTIYGSVDRKNGQRAITQWQCLKRGRSATLVCCEPITGRTHQIRAHLSGLGHPILGDVHYAKRFVCHLRPERNLLHAYSIAFKHPWTGKEIKVVAPIPIDFQRALKELLA